MSATLEEWIKREAEVLAANRSGAGSGFCTPQQMEDKTGREILEGMMRGVLPVPYSARHENICAVEVGDGEVVFQGKPEFQHLNPQGTVHGGWMANLLDSTMGSAVLSKLPMNRAFYVTEWMTVIYLKAMPMAIGRVRCWGEVRRKDSINRTISAYAAIVDAEGEKYASAEGVYKVSRGAFTS